jgi:hypothetical protein
MIEFWHSICAHNSDYGHKFSTGHFEEHTRPLSPASVGVQARLGGVVARTGRLGRTHRARTRVNANQVLSWHRLYLQGRLGVPTVMQGDGLCRWCWRHRRPLRTTSIPMVIPMAPSCLSWARSASASKASPTQPRWPKCRIGCCDDRAARRHQGSVRYAASQRCEGIIDQLGIGKLFFEF